MLGPGGQGPGGQQPLGKPRHPCVPGPSWAQRPASTSCVLSSARKDSHGEKPNWCGSLTQSLSTTPVGAAQRVRERHAGPHPSSDIGSILISLLCSPGWAGAGWGGSSQLLGSNVHVPQFPRLWKVKDLSTSYVPVLSQADTAPPASDLESGVCMWGGRQTHMGAHKPGSGECWDGGWGQDDKGSSHVRLGLGFYLECAGCPRGQEMVAGPGRGPGSQAPTRGPQLHGAATMRQD